MAQAVKFKRKTTSEIEDLEVEDGSLIYNVENGKTYMDYGSDRIPTGGGANGGIYVGDTEPQDPDITLWVDTPTSETKASEIVDEYTESDKVGYSCDYVNGANTYSTTEVDTGKTWIDGKKIYRKVIIVESLPNNTGTSYDHNISNIGTRWLTFGFWEETSGTTGPIPMYYKAAADQITQCYISDTKIYVQTNANYSSRKGYFVVEYTKSS